MKVVAAMTVAMFMSAGSLYLMADDDGGSAFYAQAALPLSQEQTAQQKLYKSECTSCHMGYQPEFLPQRSWEKIMQGLSNHFQTDASMDPKDQQSLLTYLKANAADAKRVGKHYAKMAASIPYGEAPLRISDAPYFKKEHRNIPQKFIDQKEVKSIANCNACHQTAEQGDYRERGILIPNYGRWDD